MSPPDATRAAQWCVRIFLAYLGASRHRFGWPWALAVVMLAAGLLGDLMILVIGVVPVICAALVYMRRSRSWRAGLPAFSSGVAGVVVAIAVRELVELVGTFSLTDRNLALRASLISSNFRHVPSRFAALLGVGHMKLKGITQLSKTLSFPSAKPPRFVRVLNSAGTWSKWARLR